MKSMTTVPTLRPAEPDDARAIAEFQTLCWKQAYTGLVAPDYLARVGADQREIRWQERILAGHRGIALATLTDHRIVGVTSWGLSPEAVAAPALELMTLYVEAAHHGTGVAQALLRHALGDAPAHLWAFAENGRARAFYTKHGFSPDGTGQPDVDTGLWEIRMVRPTQTSP
jgi:GNAT superfamily N-acetyltransferase